MVYVMIKYRDDNNDEQVSNVHASKETQAVVNKTHRNDGLYICLKDDEDIYTFCTQVAESDVYVAQANAYNCKLPDIKRAKSLGHWLTLCDKARRKWDVPADVIYD